MHFINLPITVLALVLLAACGGGKAPEQAAAPETPSFFKVDPATAANITGKVLFEGKAPKRIAIDMSGDSACKRQHSGPVYSEEVIVNDNGTLANVFVYVKTGLEGKAFELPKETVSIDQRGCAFQPHVLGIRAGQTFLVSNSDPVTHNIHPMPSMNREWNQGQAPGAEKLEREFARPEIMIPVKCNVHAWMRAYIGVVDHPYFAVTGAVGDYALNGLPPGDYTVEAWHEKYGTQERKVSLAPSASQVAEFTFKGE